MITNKVKKDIDKVIFLCYKWDCMIFKQRGD